MRHANLSRCNFMKALHRAAPLEAAHAPPLFAYESVRLTVRAPAAAAWHSRVAASCAARS